MKQGAFRTLCLVATATALAVLGFHSGSKQPIRRDVQNDSRMESTGNPIALLQLQRHLSKKALLDELVKKEMEVRQIQEMEKMVKSEIVPNIRENSAPGQILKVLLYVSMCLTTIWTRIHVHELEPS